MLFKDSVIIQHIFNIHIINIRGEEIQYKCIFMISGGTLREYGLFFFFKLKILSYDFEMILYEGQNGKIFLYVIIVIIYLPKFVQWFKFCIVFLVIILTFNMYCLHVFKFLIILIWMQKYRSKTQTIITKMLFKQPITFLFYFFSLISILYLLFF